MCTVGGRLRGGVHIVGTTESGSQKTGGTGYDLSDGNGRGIRPNNGWTIQGMESRRVNTTNTTGVIS